MAGKKKTEKVTKPERSPEEIRHDKERQKEGWARRERPGISKWDAGVEVMGTLVEVRPSQFEGNVLIDLKDPDGKIVTYGGPAILKDLLKGIDIGAEILIECLGKIKTRKGQEAWDFRVYEREGSKGPVSDDDVPFD